MKKTILAIITLLISNIVLCQTTEEEYNYITKGYAIQVSSGLDMKKGYEMVDIDEMKVGIRTANLKALYRVNGTTKELAAYLIVYSKIDNNGMQKEFICVPRPNSNQFIMNNYWYKLHNPVLKGDDSERLQLFFALIAKNLIWK